MTYPKILSYNINFYEKVIYYTILIFMQKKLMYNTILIFIQLLSVYYKIFTKHLITNILYNYGLTVKPGCSQTW